MESKYQKYISEDNMTEYILSLIVLYLIKGNKYLIPYQLLTVPVPQTRWALPLLDSLYLA